MQPPSGEKFVGKVSILLSAPSSKVTPPMKISYSRIILGSMPSAMTGISTSQVLLPRSPTTETEVSSPSRTRIGRKGRIPRIGLVIPPIRKTAGRSSSVLRRAMRSLLPAGFAVVLRISIRWSSWRVTSVGRAGMVISR